MQGLKKYAAPILSIAMAVSAVGCSASTGGAIKSTEGTEVLLEKQLIDVEGIGNARQLGGYVTEDGRKVKDGLLLRTASISDIPDEAVQTLSDKYNVKYVVDFRMENEREKVPDVEIPGAENIWLNVCQMNLADPAVLELLKKIQAAGDDKVQQLIEYSRAGMYENLYTDILLSEEGQKGYAQFFDILLENKDGAVLWHCTSGKDRTGIAAALVLHTLGVDEDTIMKDFLLTNEVKKEAIENLENQLKERGCEEAVVRDAIAMEGVNGDYLKAAFDRVEEEYGSLDQYISEQLGVSDEDKEALKETYLE